LSVARIVSPGSDHAAALDASPERARVWSVPPALAMVSSKAASPLATSLL
jgi:hypothetical protein